MLAGTALAGPVRAGKHMMSLQWLSDQYSTIRIAVPDGQGWQQATGAMRVEKGFMQIDGKLKRVKPPE